MTIAVAANLAEGIIFGVDSATTCFVQTPVAGTPQNISRIYDGAQKIFHIGAEGDNFNSPYAVMVFGAAFFGTYSWRNVFANFWRTLTNKPIDAIAFVNCLIAYLASVLPNQNDRLPGGLFVAGFGEQDKMVRLFRIDACALTFQEIGPFNMAWDGVPYVVQRLVFGIDNTTSETIQNLFGATTINTNDSNGAATTVAVSDVVINLIKSLSPHCAPDMSMPLRDGIDYVNFLVYSTIKHFKFTGAPICGGETEVAVITLDRGFRRIKTKPLDSQL